MATPTPAASVQFEAAFYGVGESANSVTVRVTRIGNLSGTTTVEFATGDTPATVRCDTVNGQATQRCDYETAIGTLSFAANEVSKDVVIFLWDDVHQDGTETFQISLRNASGGIIGTPATATISVTDNDTTASNINPIDVDEFFVRMQYLDFLYREPEPEGFESWLRVLRNCSDKNNNPNCDRIIVSSSFFRSTEFQIKGYFIYRFYRVSFGRLPTYEEFIRDLRRVTGQTEAEVNAALAQYTEEFRNRSDFRARYDAMSNDAYVEALQTTVGVRVANSQALKDDLNANRKSRAQVLREIVERQEVNDKEFNGGFVAAQYFGYLRRDPEAEGYNGWLTYLDRNPGDFRTMVNGFMNSVEYRLRFGKP